MKKVICIAGILIFLASVVSAKWVNGYFRKDGTYVSGYWRSSSSYSKPKSYSYGDTYVNGYYRNNGTYVRDYTRSAPDSYKWNNYGRRGSSQSLYTPSYSYDYDSDGISNQYDFDDDNDGIGDDYENYYDWYLKNWKKRR